MTAKVAEFLVVSDDADSCVWSDWGEPVAALGGARVQMRVGAPAEVDQCEPVHVRVVVRIHPDDLAGMRDEDGVAILIHRGPLFNVTLDAAVTPLPHFDPVNDNPRLPPIVGFPSYIAAYHILTKNEPMWFREQFALLNTAQPGTHELVAVIDRARSIEELGLHAREETALPKLRGVLRSPSLSVQVTPNRSRTVRFSLPTAIQTVRFGKFGDIAYGPRRDQGKFFFAEADAKPAELEIPVGMWVFLQGDYADSSTSTQRPESALFRPVPGSLVGGSEIFLSDGGFQGTYTLRLIAEPVACEVPGRTLWQQQFPVTFDPKVLFRP